MEQEYYEYEAGWQWVWHAQLKEEKGRYYYDAPQRSHVSAVSWAAWQEDSSISGYIKDQYVIGHGAGTPLRHKDGSLMIVWREGATC